MLHGEVLHALQFDNQHVFDEDIAIVFSNLLALIADDQRCLRGSADAPSSLSKARSYTFSRNPAPKILETSRIAPITRSVSESDKPQRDNQWPETSLASTHSVDAYPGPLSVVRRFSIRQVPHILSSSY